MIVQCLWRKNTVEIRCRPGDELFTFVAIINKTNDHKDPISCGTIFSAVNTGHALIDEKKRTALAKYFKLLFRNNRRIVVFGLSNE